MGKSEAPGEGGDRMFFENPSRGGGSCRRGRGRRGLLQRMGGVFGGRGLDICAETSTKLAI